MSNPDIYTLWNYRKLAVQAIVQEEQLSAEKRSQKWEAELTLTEQCLKTNPKSYGAWHHRGWTLRHMHAPDRWPKELALCDTYLQYDERNFHCWDHRREVVKASGTPAVDELGFTQRKIDSNISNFSAWHYRSFQLRKVHGPHLPHHVLRQEFEQVRHAVFTDPFDQSAWIYYAWLADVYKSNAVKVQAAAMCNASGKLVVSFTRKVDVSECQQLRMEFDAGDNYTLAWRPSEAELKLCSVWITEIPEEISIKNTALLTLHFGDQTIQVSKDTSPEAHPISFAIDESAYFSDFFCFDRGNPVLMEEIDTEIDNCQQLVEMDPESRWCVLTLIRLICTRGDERALQDCQALIEQLLSRDLDRVGYYNHLHQRLTIEFRIRAMVLKGERELDLSNCDLPSLDYCPKLIHIRKLDIANTGINQLINRSALQFSEKIVTDEPM